MSGELSLQPLLQTPRLSARGLHHVAQNSRQVTTAAGVAGQLSIIRSGGSLELRHYKNTFLYSTINIFQDIAFINPANVVFVYLLVSCCCFCSSDHIVWPRSGTAWTAAWCRRVSSRPSSSPASIFHTAIWATRSGEI